MTPVERKPSENLPKPLNLNLIDELISSRIDNLLQASGMAPVERTSEKIRSPGERERSSEKKSKKHKRKRRFVHFFQRFSLNLIVRLVGYAVWSAVLLSSELSIAKKFFKEQKQ